MSLKQFQEWGQTQCWAEGLPLPGTFLEKALAIPGGTLHIHTGMIVAMSGNGRLSGVRALWGRRRKAATTHPSVPVDDLSADLTCSLPRPIPS
jgi:hypothetical protein